MTKEEYLQKLKDPRWQKLRLQVFERDNWECQECGASNKTLCVHHRFYLPGAEPWDYPIEALITLCEDCHIEETEQRVVVESQLLFSCKMKFLSSSLSTLYVAIREFKSKYPSDEISLLLAWVLENQTLQDELINRYYELPGDKKTMASRYTETEKWDDLWFRKLSLEAKVLFEYMRDTCDIAGFWKVDLDLASLRTGIPKEDSEVFQQLKPLRGIEGALKELDRAFLGASKGLEGGVWLKNFLRHQKNLPLNEQNPAHKRIIQIIKSHNSFADIVLQELGRQIKERGIEGAMEGLRSPLGNGNGKGNLKGGEGGIEEFEVFWKVYPRKVGKGKARDWWIKHKPSKELLQKIIMSIQQQVKTAQWKKEGGTFIPHPITWLNQERWDDEININLGKPEKTARQREQESVKAKVQAQQTRDELMKRFEKQGGKVVVPKSIPQPMSKIEQEQRRQKILKDLKTK